MKPPRVSVIMSVYNAEKYVHKTIDSILNQDFVDFEFLIADDCSTDRSFDIISAFKDPRIKVYKNDVNLGYVRTLNYLINSVKGEYIARQDADDISHLNRLKLQVIFMENNLNVGVCGTNAKIFGKKKWMASSPIKDADIRASMIIRNPFIHSSVMIRRSMFLGVDMMKYNYLYYPSEDYYMWFEISLKAELANLPNRLLQIRWHESNVSHLNNIIQIEKANLIRHKVLEYSISIEMTNDEKRLHDLLFKTTDISEKDLKSLELWLLKILTINKSKKYFSEKALKKVIFSFWTLACFRKNEIPLIKLIFIYISSELFKVTSLLNQISLRNFKNLIVNTNI